MCILDAMLKLQDPNGILGGWLTAAVAAACLSSNKATKTINFIFKFVYIKLQSTKKANEKSIADDDNDDS